MNIRPAVLEDMKFLAPWVEEGFKPTQEDWTAETALSYLQHFFSSPSAKSFVAEDHRGNVIGGIIYHDGAFDSGHFICFDMIVVDPAYEGQGVGGKLIEIMEREAEEREDIGGIYFVANPKLKSYHWYIRRGYQLSGWVELFKAK